MYRSSSDRTEQNWDLQRYANAYGFDSFRRVVTVAIGDETTVWRAETERGPVCLKVLHPDRDPADFLRRALLMEKLRVAGIPFPMLIGNGNGEAITTVDSRTIGIWAWSDGALRQSFNVESVRSAARQSAKLHRALRQEPVACAYDGDEPRWLTEPVAVAEETCQTLLTRIARIDRKNPADVWYQSALTQRLLDLQHVNDLRQSMPKLAAQLVHHDYTRPNLLFEDNRVAAILDLKGHVASPLWELGKIAFEPQTVTRSLNWLEIACSAIAEYCAEEPSVRETAWSCARAIVLYNLFSFWGPWQRYIEGMRPGQADMDEYWLNRHTTARLLLANLAIVEDGIAQSCAAGR